MRTYAALALLLSIGAPGAAFAQQTHSAEDEAACTPDVMRLCQEFIPDRDAIVTCLIKKKKDMSPECTKVFSRPRLGDNERRRQRSKPASQQASGQ
jgi:hypothetical protein